ncbi:hypothetical protein M885DRAFT_532160 [Pelagophyceae sp. CCMP2097]|nr:hypothetical protein M885DRAFT_532160 [Pelagophyceae sp. CCMP2097]
MTDELLDEFEAKIVLGHLQINKGLSKINPATGEPRAEEFSRDNYVPRTDTKSGYKFGQKPEEPEGEGAPEDMSYILKDRRNGSFIEPEEYDFMEHERARTKPSPLEQRLDPRAGDAKRRCNKNTKYHLINKDMADISNLPLLREFLTDNGLIEKRRDSRLCAKCQRMIAKRLKRARQMGIIPSTSTYTAHNLLGFPDKKHQALISKTI